MRVFVLMVALLAVCSCGIKPNRLDIPREDGDPPYPRVYPSIEVSDD